MIRFAFYGRLSDVMGRRRTLNTANMEMAVGEAIELLCAEDDRFREAIAGARAKFAVHDRLVGLDYVVRSGDEISVLPPFSGG